MIMWSQRQQVHCILSLIMESPLTTNVYIENIEHYIDMILNNIIIPYKAGRKQRLYLLTLPSKCGSRWRIVCHTCK